MNEIVWAINPRRDRLQDLVARMRRFAADMLAGRHIALSFRAPAAQDVPLDAGVRRQAFLIFKEAIHNAVRHSRCSEVQVAVAFQSRRLTVDVIDNGDGFDGRQPAAEGHGLRSMEARARDLGGRVDVVSTDGRGTSIHLSVPLRRRRLVPARVSDSVLSMLRVCRSGGRDISVGTVNDQISNETVATE
jgi:signal transduction histidine kinase